MLRNTVTLDVVASGKDLISFRIQFSDQFENQAKPSPQPVHLCGKTRRQRASIAGFERCKISLVELHRELALARFC
jgi:hypothetical protein